MAKFPDLTGDGKTTQADILKGRGVFKKGGSTNFIQKAIKKPGALARSWGLSRVNLFLPKNSLQPPRLRVN
jgi:hypothetical protein